MNGKSQQREGEGGYFDVCRPHPAPSIETRMRIKRDWAMQEKQIKGCVLPTVQACHGCELKIGDKLAQVSAKPVTIVSFYPHRGLGMPDGTHESARVANYIPDGMSNEVGVTIFDNEIFVDEGDGVYKPRHWATAAGTAEAVASLTPVAKPDESGT